MRYQTRIVGDVVEVTSSHTGTVYTYTIPPGISPAAYALRCAERARVSECLTAVLVGGHRKVPEVAGTCISRGGSLGRRFRLTGPYTC